MKALYDLPHYGIKESLRSLYEDSANPSMIGQQHTGIFRAIGNRDPDAACAARKHHTNLVLNFF